MPKKPADAPISEWEAKAEALGPRGEPVSVFGRDWPPGEWLPLLQGEKEILDANYNVLTVRKARSNGG